ncbi:MAG: LamG-like jellyroll fold domain-containing protein [Pseudomonadota bacterium]
MISSILTPLGSSAQSLSFEPVVGQQSAIALHHDSLQVLTIEAWVRPASNPQPVRYIASKSQPGAGLTLVTINQSGAARYGFEVNNSEPVSTLVTSSSTSQLNEWSHIAGVISDGQARLYVNGELEGERSLAGGTGFNTADLTLGTSPVGVSSNWHGLIDEVRTWSVARTQEQIQAAINRSLVGELDNLVGYWRFFEGEGSQSLDSSGQSFEAQNILGTMNLVNVAWGGNAPLDDLSSGPDPFEPDDTIFAANPLAIEAIETRTFNAGDEEWIRFRLATECNNTMAHRVVPLSSDPRFQPIVETYSTEILSNPAAPPTGVYGSCGQNRAVEFDSWQPFWRIRNCPDAVAPGEAVGYALEFVYRDGICGLINSVSGVVRELTTGQPVGSSFVLSSTNNFSATNPATGEYAFANVGSPVTIDLVSEQFEAPSQSITVAGGQMQRVDFCATQKGTIFLGGFEAANCP